MHTPHVSSGGRYPVLRAVAILFLLGALGIIAGGIYAAVLAFQLPDSTLGRIGWASLALAGTFFGALTAVGIAELIKLFIDVERNTRAAAMRAAAIDVIASPSGTTTVVATGNSDGAGGRMGQWLEGEETAEGALIRGH
jgi:hypothetical protein